MNAQTRHPDAIRLDSIRALLDAIAPGDWTRVADGNGEFIEARGQLTGELIEVARFHPGATAAEMTFAVDAPRNVRFLLDLVDRAIAKERARLGQGQAAAPVRTVVKDYAAEAAMKCQEPAFKAFLEQRHGLERPLTDERVAQKVRTLCGVTSRKELNESDRAAQAWKDLRASFDAWKRTGQ